MRTRLDQKSKPKVLNTSTPEWNVKMFEEKLEREVQHRKNLLSSNQLLIATDDNSNNSNESNDINDPTGTFSQFLLIGVHPDLEITEPKAKPRVLVAYPPFEYPNLPIKPIVDHCFPTGPVREYLSHNDGSAIQDEFVFQFGGNTDPRNKPIYGVCVHVSTKYTARPFYGSRRKSNHLYCFCLMTKSPAFATHFSFLTYLALMTIGHVKRIHRYDEQLRVNMEAYPAIIDYLNVENQIGHNPSFEVPNVFQNELAMYYVYSICKPSERISTLHPEFMNLVRDKHHHKHRSNSYFKYEAKDLEIYLKFPKKSDIYNNAICWASLDTLFSLLSVSDILYILSGLLLDRQVLIIGSKLEEITMTIWALQALLKPFSLLTIIPILPIISDDYLGLLDLPTPFLIGVPKCSQIRTTVFLETSIFVDLDANSVPTKSNLQPYPNHLYVEYQLNEYLDNLLSFQAYNEFHLPDIYTKTLMHKYAFSQDSCREIIQIIQQPFENTLFSSFICGFFVTDMSDEYVTIFNSVLFLAHIESQLSVSLETLYETNTGRSTEATPEEYQFWQLLVDSQTFQMYIEERLSQFLEEKHKQHEMSQNNQSFNEKKTSPLNSSDDRIQLADFSKSTQGNKKRQSFKVVRRSLPKTQISKTASLAQFISPVKKESFANSALKVVSSSTSSEDNDEDSDNDGPYDYSNSESDERQGKSLLKANNGRSSGKKIDLFKSAKVQSSSQPRKSQKKSSKKVAVTKDSNLKPVPRPKKVIKKGSLHNEFDSSSSSEEEDEPIRRKSDYAKNTKPKVLPRKKSKPEVLTPEERKSRRKTLDPEWEITDVHSHKHKSKVKTSGKTKPDVIRKSSQEEKNVDSTTKAKTPKKIPKPPPKKSVNSEKLKRKSGSNERSKPKNRKYTSETDSEYNSDSEEVKSKLMKNDKFDYSSD